MEPLTSAETILSKALQPLRFMVVDGSSSRKSVQALLARLKIGGTQVDMIDNFGIARELIAQKRPNVIFADQILNDQETLPFTQLQKSCLAPNELRAFFYIASKDSKVVASGAAEEEADSVLLKPLTFAGLQSTFIDTMTKKLNPSEYDAAIQKVETLMRENQAAAALPLLAHAKTKNPKPALAFYWEGKAFESLQRVEEAKKSYEGGLQLQPDHYRCMLALLELLIQLGDHKIAYDLGRKLAEAHTVPLKHLPTLIRISILNNQYADVLSFHQAAESMGTLDPQASLHLAAGLVVCGVYLLERKDQSAAIDAFKKAERKVPGNKKVLKRILLALGSAGLGEPLHEMLGRVPPDIREDAEVQAVELLCLEKSGFPAIKVLDLGLQLLNRGVKDARIYRLLIEKSVELKREPLRIQEIVAKACADHPDRQAEFQALAKNPGAVSG